MTLVGLEYMKNQETRRHNKATESQAERDRVSREDIANADRGSREKVAALDRSSRESIASADRTSRQEIASLDRLVESEDSRYSTDMSFLGKAGNPVANMVMSSAIATDRVGADTWGSQQTTSPLRDLITSTIRATDAPLEWTEDTINNVVDAAVQAVQDLDQLGQGAPGHGSTVFAQGSSLPRLKRGNK